MSVFVKMDDIKAFMRQFALWGIFMGFIILFMPNSDADTWCHFTSTTLGRVIMGSSLYTLSCVLGVFIYFLTIDTWDYLTL